MKKLKYLLVLITANIFVGCGLYSFTGGDSGNAKSIQINYFNNNAALVEPNLSQAFTTKLQDFFNSQTNLPHVKTNGDLTYEGEIVRYTIVPMTATSNFTAAQNRLTIEINVRYINKLDEAKNFEKRFTHFYDYDANATLQGDLLDSAYQEIFERINQEIFNASIGNW